MVAGCMRYAAMAKVGHKLGAQKASETGREIPPSSGAPSTGPSASRSKMGMLVAGLLVGGLVGVAFCAFVKVVIVPLSRQGAAIEPSNARSSQFNPPIND
jgi:hypothetical protein